jgi:GNAT superfamily N-acetyltransferase
LEVDKNRKISDNLYIARAKTKNMKISIRPAVITDYPHILGLFREFSVYQKLPERMKNSLEKMEEEREYLHAFVAETETNKIIGYVTWFYTYFTWSGKGMYIDDLYVKPEFRGTGIGKLLMNKIIELARDSKCHKLRWQVSHWNKTAIAFYEKLGAELDDLEKNCDLNLD